MDFSDFWKLLEKSEATEAYAGSGRRHSQIKMIAMQLQAETRIHVGVGMIQRRMAQTVIMAAALYLALRLTKPPAAQFRSMGPNSV